MRNLGTWIKEQRIAKGLKQWEFAELIGTSRAYMSQIEAGGTKLPNADLRRRIAAALNASHLDVLIAAGELTADEVRALGVEGVPTENETETELVGLVRSINWEPDKASYVRSLLTTMKGIDT